MTAQPVDEQNNAVVGGDQRINDTPGAPSGGANIPAQSGKVVHIATDARREFVSSGLTGTSGWYTNYPRSLPWPIDDVSGDFGDDIYERMALDPKITETLTILKTGIIEEGALLTSPITDKSDKNAELATQILDAARSMLENLDGDLDAILWNMLDALHVGNKVAELVFDYVDGENGTRLDITRIAVKPRKGTAFVVDAYGKVVGLLAQIPGVSGTTIQGSFIDPEYVPNILPREKFWVVTSRPADEDIRGTSILRPAFEFWNIKHQIIREYLKYLTQFASASLFATTPEGADFAPAKDPTTGAPTGTMVNPWEVLKGALEQFRNGSVLTAPFGTTLKEIFSQGDGTAFRHALDYISSEIVSSILGQTLASEEGRHQSRAAASSHQDILSAIIRQAKRSVCRSFRRDILVPWVARNWGPQYVALTPIMSLGETELPNLPQLMTAVANLFNSAYISPSQLTGLDTLLNLSQRTPEEMATIIKKFEEGTLTPASGNPNARISGDGQPQDNKDNTDARR